MISFIVFFLSFLANIIIIKVMPDAHLRVYINVYTIVGGFGALTFFLIYSKENLSSRIRKIGTSLALVYVLAFLSLDGFWASAAVYPLILIYNDYIVTQASLPKVRSTYRLFLIFSVIPFLLFTIQFEILFQVRVILMVGALLYFTRRAKEITSLPVRSIWKYIFFNYSFYYAPLLLIANLPMAPSAVKVWYLCSQGGLVAYLKYLDFAIRKDHKTSGRIEKYVLFGAVGAPILPVFFYPSAAGLVAYFSGLFGLVHSKRYLNIIKTK